MLNHFDLLSQVPQILRARGFRLYTEGGRRLIDLWLNGGAAVLGHTPPNLLKELKNTASRGLYAPYPHFTEARFIKALSKLLPGNSFRYYAAPPDHLSRQDDSINQQKTDQDKWSGKPGIWRPFTDSANPFKTSTTNLSVLVLPGIQTWRGELPFGLCVVACNAVAAFSEEQLAPPEAQLPPNDILPPTLLATATRGIHDLIAASPQRARPQLPRTFKALKADNCPWRREGIYLSLKETPTTETWATLFAKFLQAGFLLPPTPAHPLILPGELSDGEDAKLAGVL